MPTDVHECGELGVVAVADAHASRRAEHALQQRERFDQASVGGGKGKERFPIIAFRTCISSNTLWASFQRLPLTAGIAAVEQPATAPSALQGVCVLNDVSSGVFQAVFPRRAVPQLRRHAHLQLRELRMNGGTVLRGRGGWPGGGGRGSGDGGAGTPARRAACLRVGG
jgi:hypothetical protein